jgi:hypothetical protein
MADEDGKLVGVIGDEDTVTGFLLAGVGHRTMEGANFLVVKNGKCWGGGGGEGEGKEDEEGSMRMCVHAGRAEGLAHARAVMVKVLK